MTSLHAKSNQFKNIQLSVVRYENNSVGLTGGVCGCRVEDVVDVLRQMPPREVDHKLALMAQLRSVFSFDTQLTEPPNAANVLLEGICRRGTQPPLVPQPRPE